MGIDVRGIALKALSRRSGEWGISGDFYGVLLAVFSSGFTDNAEKNV